MSNFFKKIRIKPMSLLRWSILVLVPVVYLLVSFGVRDHELQKMRDFANFLSIFIPLAIMFAVHDILLLRQLYNKGRVKLYLLSLVVLFAGFCFYTYHRLKNEQHPHFEKEENNHKHDDEGVAKPFEEKDKPPRHKDGEERPHKDGKGRPPRDGKPDKGKHGKGKSGPNPLALDMVLAVLLLSSDFAINLYIRYSNQKEIYEKQERERLNNELQYLKAQLNPHFFMNTLNNIHGMVEINPTNAQEMIMELSKLMRYVLYEGERNFTTLSTEVEFIENYASLMRKRYSTKKVDITLRLPHDELYGIKLPPLLFMVIIENAFKHGISYRSHSDISIELDVLPKNRLKLTCTNSKWEKKQDSANNYGGIGLKNLKKRLSLLYGSRFSLEKEENDIMYKAILTIPYENDENHKVSGD